jgi:hypothetical protein
MRYDISQVTSRALTVQNYVFMDNIDGPSCFIVKSKIKSRLNIRQKTYTSSMLYCFQYSSNIYLMGDGSIV